MTYVVIDIETAMNERCHEYYKKKTYYPAANLKDPEKIKQSILERRQKDMESAALHWWTGKVICLSATVLTPSYKPALPLTGPLTLYGHDEKKILSEFFDFLASLEELGKAPQIVGKSSDYFDRPFLVGRALALDTGLPRTLRFRDTLSDIDGAFGWSSQCDQRSNLADYAWGLDIPGKTGHGSDVGALYAQIQMGSAQWSQLTQYCEQDNAITVEFLKRWVKPFIATTVKAAEPIEIPFG